MIELFGIAILRSTIGEKLVAGVTVKFKSGVTRFTRKHPHFDLSDPDPDIFPIRQLELGVLFVLLETAFKSPQKRRQTPDFGVRPPKRVCA
jgi:hypothetical protein